MRPRHYFDSVRPESNSPLQQNVVESVSPEQRAEHAWRFLFSAGDLAFLTAVGSVTTVTMHAMHQTGWPFAVAMLTGMAAAMVVQMLLAVCVSPLLGSIETMTPSMVVGMVSPMLVCTLHLFECESTCGLAMILGAAFGIGMFAFIEIYGIRCRRRLDLASPPRERP